MSLDFTQYKALSFDCYGTLIDWESGLSSILLPWAHTYDPTITSDTILAAYAQHEAEIERTSPTMKYPQIIRESFLRLGKTLGFPVSEITEITAEKLAQSIPSWPAFNDSAAALHQLQQYYHLIILSNVDRDSFTASNTKLGVHFPDILTAEDIGTYKPHRNNFIALLRRTTELGFAGKTLHVAQSLFHDHLPAQQLGLSTVWINRRYDKPGWGATPAPDTKITPDAQFNSMAEFANAVTIAFEGSRSIL